MTPQISFMISALSTFLILVLFLIAVIKTYGVKKIKKFLKGEDLKEIIINPEIIKLAFYLLVSIISVYIIKFSLRFSRPSLEGVLFSFDKYTFPSSHATIAGALGLYIGSPLSIISAIFIGVLRYFSHAHYMRDIVGGWLLSIILYVIFYERSFLSRIKKNEKTLLRKILHMIFGSALIGVGVLWYEYFVLLSISIGIAYIILLYSSYGKKIYKSIDHYKDKNIDMLSPLAMVVGSVISYWMYEYKIFMISLLFLTYMDALSTLFGKVFPYVLLPNKRHLSGTIISALIGYLVVAFLFSEVYATISTLSFIFYEIVFPNSEILEDNLIIPFWIGLWILISLGYII